MIPVVALADDDDDDEADVDVVANELPFQWLPWLLSLGGKTPPGRRGSTRETAL